MAQHTIPRVAVLRRVSSDTYDYDRFATPIGFNSGLDPINIHTSRREGLDRPRQVGLPECGRRAGHGWSAAAYARKSRKTRKGVPFMKPDPFLVFLDFLVAGSPLKKAGG